jgi:hypothetical protein
MGDGVWGVGDGRWVTEIVVKTGAKTPSMKSLYTAMNDVGFKVTKREALLIAAAFSPYLRNAELATVAGYKHASSLSDPEIEQMLKVARHMGKLYREDMRFLNSEKYGKSVNPKRSTRYKKPD